VGCGSSPAGPAGAADRLRQLGNGRPAGRSSRRWRSADRLLPDPSDPPQDELFHQAISTSCSSGSTPFVSSPLPTSRRVLVGAAHELREVLGQCALRTILPRRLGRGPQWSPRSATPPGCRWWYSDGEYLVDPSNAELMSARAGRSIRRGVSSTGHRVPVGGLSAAVYGASEGLRTLVSTRRDRRPGEPELADPQLPRLSARGQRRRLAERATSRRGSSAPSSRSAEGAGLRREDDRILVGLSDSRVEGAPSSSPPGHLPPTQVAELERWH